MKKLFTLAMDSPASWFGPPGVGAMETVGTEEVNGPLVADVRSALDTVAALDGPLWVRGGSLKETAAADDGGGGRRLGRSRP